VLIVLTRDGTLKSNLGTKKPVLILFASSFFSLVHAVSSQDSGYGNFVGNAGKYCQGGVRIMIRDKLLTMDEAADLAKCSYHTIHRAIKNGDLPAYKPGKIVLVLEEDLSTWFKSKRIQAVRPGRPRRRIEIHRGE
jgi:excisionase family DNA binding protein